MSLEVRYDRSFLIDLKYLDPIAYERIYDFVFVKVLQINRLRELPELRQLGQSGIFYRCSVDNYLIGLEVTGHLIKFIRILPKPDR